MLHYAEQIPWNHYFCTDCFDTCTVLLWSLKPSLAVPHPLHPLFPSLAFFLSVFHHHSFHFLHCYPLHLVNSSLALLLFSVGRLLIEFSSQMTMERVQKENPNVTEGGRYTPPDCRPRWKVCVSVWSSHVFNNIYILTHFFYGSPFTV